MSGLMIVIVFGILLVLFGAVIGAELQDKRHEAQRRRMAQQRREINTRWQALQGRGAAFELAVPGRGVVIPLDYDLEGPD
jgi:hypothetical protein